MRRILDRPIFVIAMPRSGSTLLFDILRAHEELRSWDTEAYPAWAAVDPHVATGERGDAFDPARLDASARRRCEWALHQRVWRQGRWRERKGWVRYRFVEKTPANVIRVQALDTMFPDALFVHLTRDAPASIASMLEGRERRLAVRGWPSRQGVEWHFLMPPGWRQHVAEPPAAQFAWQWLEGNNTAADDLARIPPERRCRVRYEDLLDDAPARAAELVRFAGLTPSRRVREAATALAPSAATLSAPHRDKWRSRVDEIEPHLAPLAALRRRLGYGA